MSSQRGRARRPALHITLGRASRLFHLIHVLSGGAGTREQILSRLRIGLRTFYREIELLKRVGVRVRFAHKRYELRTTLGEAEDRLPFPDPQLTFAEMKELAACPGPAAQRLSGLFHEVIDAATAPPPAKKKSRRQKKS